jgi:hypothetical protein
MNYTRGRINFQLGVRLYILKKLLNKEMQNWIKFKFWFKPNEFGLSYAAVPLVQFITSDLIKIIFSTRNSNNQSIPYSIYFDLKEMKILGEPKCLDLYPGELGTFDDSGIMPTSIINYNGENFLYYIGWNLGVTVPFRNSIGIAKELPEKGKYSKLFYGPIIDRTIEDPYFVASCHVIEENGIFKMWYLSCQRWKIVSGKLTHFYNIKYAESVNGINWNRTGKVAIDFKHEDECAISCPRVIIEDDKYKMWYSYRDINTPYKIGYAESINGIDWQRKDDLVCLNTFGMGFDDEMQCYPFVFKWNNCKYMLYNGNRFGKTGFGLLKLE